MLNLNTKIDKKSPSPLYTQIADIIRDKVVGNEWSEGYKLPSEEILCGVFEVSRGTIRKSISLLIQEGVLIQIHGKGTFVKENKSGHRFGQELISFAESMNRKNLEFTTKVIDKYMIKDENIIQTSEFIKKNNNPELMYLKRLRYIEEKPIILLENIVDTSLCPNILNVDFEEETLFNSIENQSGKKINYGTREFKAIRLNRSEAYLLNETEGEPILFIKQVSYLENMEPVESSNIYLKSDQYPISSYLYRN
ncbi:GntR family transcriptional regulator [Oceanobacillus jeddahense]|uniref:GntR family transcriptional regulator n=1 Tax=Oceanobacillus jeddahense TaxID=1462527 RepID=A0ABY5JRN9_9BACI|nr:GntR family transcriptional regulator [Oceanobacillus jeddahense]UUI02987.1 GntR family transcriptional regulator [Oceanobacillus jeddahense]